MDADGDLVRAVDGDRIRCNVDVLSAAGVFPHRRLSRRGQSGARWDAFQFGWNGKHTRHYGGARADTTGEECSATNTIASIDKARADSAQSRRWERSKCP